MELKTFISETLKQIADGIKDGHEHIAKNDLGKGVRDLNPITVGFDISVRVEETDQSHLGGKVGVMHVLGVGGGTENSRKNSSENRLTFEVVVSLKTLNEKNWSAL